MNLLPNPEQVLLEMDSQLFCTEILAIMTEYGRQVRDKTLEWAANNTFMDEDEEGFRTIDKESILAGKTHKDLEI